MKYDISKHLAYIYFAPFLTCLFISWLVFTVLVLIYTPFILLPIARRRGDGYVAPIKTAMRWHFGRIMEVAQGFLSNT